MTRGAGSLPSASNGRGRSTTKSSCAAMDASRSPRLGSAPGSDGNDIRRNLTAGQKWRKLHKYPV